MLGQMCHAHRKVTSSGPGYGCDLLAAGSSLYYESQGSTLPWDVGGGAGVKWNRDSSSDQNSLLASSSARHQAESQP